MVFWGSWCRYKYLSGATLWMLFIQPLLSNPMHTQILSLQLLQGTNGQTGPCSSSSSSSLSLCLSNALSTSFLLCRPWALQWPQPVKYTDTHTCMLWPCWPFSSQNETWFPIWVCLTALCPLPPAVLPPSFLQSVLMWLGLCACFPHAVFFVFLPLFHFSPSTTQPVFPSFLLL